MNAQFIHQGQSKLSMLKDINEAAMMVQRYVGLIQRISPDQPLSDELVGMVSELKKSIFSMEVKILMLAVSKIPNMEQLGYVALSAEGEKFMEKYRNLLNERDKKFEEDLLRLMN